MSNKTILTVKNLGKKFLDSEPLKDINCEIHQGEVISIIGPSGTGKSTFLRCINRLEKPTSGQIFFHGEELTDSQENIRLARQKIGMVFQSFNLFSNMNVLENIILAPMMLKKIEKNFAMLIVTHEMRFAEKVSDRIFFMNDGIIFEEGTPQDLIECEESKTAKFLKEYI